MRIALRLDSLEHPRTGIGYYTEHLCRQLYQLPGVELEGIFNGHAVSGFALGKLLDKKEGDKPASKGVGDRLHLRSSPLLRAMPGAYSLRQWLRDFRAVGAVSGRKFDLYHEPNFIPFRFQGRLVVTVHDLSHLRHPEFHPVGRVRFLKKYLSTALQRADLVITDSVFTQNEIAAFFPEAANKVTAIHLGVEEGIHEVDEGPAQQVLSQWGLGFKAYILSVATLEPRKNLVGLVRAYSRLPSHLKSVLPLVLVGSGGWNQRELLRLIESVNRGPGRVILTGRVPRQDLASLLTGARLFVYPSFYEGFGLPIAEARACGTPLLTSGFGAMAEVAGDQAFLADPFDLSEGLEQALETMPARVPCFRFSWKTTAEKTLMAYQSL